MNNRWEYYRDIIQPIQVPLLEMGLRGMPCDEAAVARHRRAIARIERMAAIQIGKAGLAPLHEEAEKCRKQIDELEDRRNQERDKGSRKFSSAAELSSLRGKLKRVESNIAAGFNPSSAVQKKALLYDHFGLPVVLNRQTKQPTTNDEAVDKLLAKLTSGKAKPKRGTPEEAIRVLNAVRAVSIWRHWEQAFLNPVLRTGPGLPRILTKYSCHRAESGRLSSGTDRTDEEKTRKVTQLQNVPRYLRDIVRANPGHVLIGGDWRAVEWCVAMWYGAAAGSQYHRDMLDKFARKLLDPHLLLAQHLFAISPTEKQRRIAKTITFGYLYDGNPEGLAERAGLPRSRGTDAARAHDNVFRLRDVKSRILHDVNSRRYAITAGGWIRYFFGLNIDTGEALATTISGTAADICKYVLARLAAACHTRGYDLLTTTHDSFLIEVPEPEAAAAQEFLQQMMETPIPFMDNEIFSASVKVGPTWRDVS